MDGWRIMKNRNGRYRIERWERQDGLRGFWRVLPEVYPNYESALAGKYHAMKEDSWIEAKD
jgi:hypothetical protein